MQRDIGRVSLLGKLNPADIGGWSTPWPDALARCLGLAPWVYVVLDKTRVTAQKAAAGPNGATGAF